MNFFNETFHPNASFINAISYLFTFLSVYSSIYLSNVHYYLLCTYLYLLFSCLYLSYLRIGIIFVCMSMHQATGPHHGYSQAVRLSILVASRESSSCPPHAVQHPKIRWNTPSTGRAWGGFITVRLWWKCWERGSLWRMLSSIAE